MGRAGAGGSLVFATWIQILCGLLFLALLAPGLVILLLGVLVLLAEVVETGALGGVGTAGSDALDDALLAAGAAAAAGQGAPTGEQAAHLVGDAAADFLAHGL